MRQTRWTKTLANKHGLEWDGDYVVPKQFGRVYVMRACTQRDMDGKHCLSPYYLFGEPPIQTEWVFYFDHQCDEWSIGNADDLRALLADLEAAHKFTEAVANATKQV